MVQVLCTRENASELISGVKFSLHKDKDGGPLGMISEEITEKQAEMFLSIPGYALVEKEAAPAPAPAPRAAKPKAEKKEVAEAPAAKETAAPAAPIAPVAEEETF